MLGISKRQHLWESPSTGRLTQAKIWDRILRIVKTHPEFSRAYAFSYDPPPENNVFFIVVVDPSVQKKERLVTALEEELGEVFPELNFEINIALDF